MDNTILSIGGKPQAIQNCKDREDVYFELGLTAAQAEKLGKRGVTIFQSETYLEKVKHNFKRYYTIVKIDDLVKILTK